MPWHLYILRCLDNSLYIGISKNPYKRLNRHNQGTGSLWVKQHELAKIIYLEKYRNYKICRCREVQFKKWSRQKKENLIKGLHPNL